MNHRCIASTPEAWSDQGLQFTPEQDGLQSRRSKSHHHGHCSSTSTHAASKQSTFFKSAQFSADGTSIITNGEDNLISTFVLPPNLLTPISPTPSNPQGQHILYPHTTHRLPEPSYALASHPYFTLSDPSTTLLLTSPRDHPLQLTNALDPSTYPKPISTYPLIDPHTEAYVTPHSLLFTHDSRHVVAGADCVIAIFDVERTGEGPAERVRTVPSRRYNRVGGGVGFKGVVSAMSLAPAAANTASTLAIGTFTRWVGLYERGGRGGCAAVFSVTASDSHKSDCDVHGDLYKGRGITQLAWSPCARYLVVAERGSNGVLVYDVRVTGRRLGWLSGRKAVTNQRMGLDVVASVEKDGAWDVWAGGTDGTVRVWKDVGGLEEVKGADNEWRAHGDAVSSTLMHYSASVAATCSGQRDLEWPDWTGDWDAGPVSENEQSRDNTLKIWAL